MWLPMQLRFPAIQSSDYSHAYSSPEHLVPDRNGHRVTQYGKGNHVGTHQVHCPRSFNSFYFESSCHHYSQGQALYGHIGQLANNLKGLLVAEGQAFEKTAFNAFLYDVQTHLSWRLASPHIPTAVKQKQQQNIPFFAFHLPGGTFVLTSFFFRLASASSRGSVIGIGLGTPPMPADNSTIPHTMLKY